MAAKKQPEANSGRATSYDVARQAGVSQSAVSRCFKQGASVAPRTREKILAAARELNYYPNAIAQGLITRRSNLVAIIISNLTNLYYPEVLAELTQRSMARQQEYRKEIESQLAEVTREVQSDVEKFVAVSADLDRMEIKSPANGQVVGLSVQTVGAVLQPGQKLLDVVPDNQTLMLEAHIPPHLIDKVQSGLPADVRFNAFAHSPQLVVEGKVISISGDLLSDPQQPQYAYYLARVQVTPSGMKTLGQRQMQPGMPTEIVIKTGERSLLTYLLHPLTKRMAASMKEE